MHIMLTDESCTLTVLHFCVELKLDGWKFNTQTGFNEWDFSFPASGGQ